MDFEEVKAAVEKAARGRKEITCHETRQFADDLDVEYSVVGRACNKLGIRLKLCQWAPWCTCPPGRERKSKDKKGNAPAPGSSSVPGPR